MSENELTEPWLRGTLQEIPAVQRAVVHALQLAGEDLQRWCGGLSDEQIDARPGGLPPVAFHLRHIARSLDRLLTYAEGRDLDDEQLSAKRAEMEPGATREELFAEVNSALAQSEGRVRAFDPGALEQGRRVGTEALAHDCRRVAGACRGSHPASRGAGTHDGENRYHRLRVPAAFAAGSACYCAVVQFKVNVKGGGRGRPPHTLALSF